MNLNIKKKIGINGDGQLARFLALSALKNNCEIIFYTLNKENSPCRDLPGKFICGNSWSDAAALQTFLSKIDILLLENEFIPGELFTVFSEDKLKSSYPYASTYKLINGKNQQGELARNLGIKTPNFYILNYPEDLIEFEEINEKKMLKSVTGGYDGYGNFLYDPEKIKAGPDSQKFKQQALDFFVHSKKIIVQDFLAFEKEVAILFVKQVDPNNAEKIELFPICETHQENNICHYVTVPAQIAQNLTEKIKRHTLKIAKALPGEGLFAVEYFIYQNDVYFNEIAPRPHNSGHYTIDSTNISQYEALVRLALKKEIPAVTLNSKHSAMLNLLGTKNGNAIFRGDLKFNTLKNSKLHLYNKAVSRPGRKMGHFTIWGDDEKELLQTIKELRQRYDI